MGEHIELDWILVALNQHLLDLAHSHACALQRSCGHDLSISMTEPILGLFSVFNRVLTIGELILTFINMMS